MAQATGQHCCDKRLLICSCHCGCAPLQQDAEQPGLEQEASAVDHLAVISPRTDVTTAARCTSGGTLALPQAQSIAHAGHAGHAATAAAGMGAMEPVELQTGNNGLGWVVHEEFT